MTLRSGSIVALALALSVPMITAAQWEQLPLPSPYLTDHGMAVGRVSAKPVIFQFGGFRGSVCQDTVRGYHVYPPAPGQAPGSWHAKAPLPSPRCGAEAVPASGLRRIFLIGGRVDAVQQTDRVDVYDAHNDRWDSKAPLPRALADHGAVEGPDGAIYVFGGNADSSQDLRRAVYRFTEPPGQPKGVWTRLSDMPAPLADAAAFRLGRYIYVVTWNRINVFEPVEEKWATFTINSLDQTPAGGLASQGALYLETSGLYRYRPSAEPLKTPGTFETLRPSTSFRSAHSATGIGRTLFVAGESKGSEAWFGSYKLPKNPGTWKPGSLGHVKWEEVDQRPAEIHHPQLHRVVGGNWTPWLDRDGPSGSGDYETLKAFLTAGEACATPQEIQCRTADDGESWEKSGQVYHCEPQRGGWCVNSEQPPGQRCRNYQVRFRCP